MQLWQLDIMGSVMITDPAASGGVTEAKLISGIDDHSRYSVIATVVPRASARAVCTALITAMAEYGVPEEVLTDNGRQFTGRFGAPRPAEVLFERICRHDGITQRLTKPANCWPMEWCLPAMETVPTAAGSPCAWRSPSRTSCSTGADPHHPADPDPHPTRPPPRRPHSRSRSTDRPAPDPGATHGVLLRRHPNHRLTRASRATLCRSDRDHRSRRDRLAGLRPPRALDQNGSPHQPQGGPPTQGLRSHHKPPNQLGTVTHHPKPIRHPSSGTRHGTRHAG